MGRTNNNISENKSKNTIADELNTITIETARIQPVTADEAVRHIFAALVDETGKSVITDGAMDAVFLDAGRSRVLGVCGLPFYMPVCSELINDHEIRKFLWNADGNILIRIIAESRETNQYKVYVAADGQISETDVDESVIPRIDDIIRRLEASPGRFNDKGELILDLRGQKVGLHYPVNLLLGDRTGYEYPLISTPKSSVDALGRGSFRAAGGDQVLATRYVMEPEENGEPANRQFYLFEAGQQIFWSADVNTNVSKAECRQSQNRTVITYTTEDGLEITRTIFILSQEDGMPEAVEAQRITIRDLTGRGRRLRIVATGVFGTHGPGTITQDIVYANLVSEAAVLSHDGRPFCVTHNARPAEDRTKKRFAMILSGGEAMDEYSTSQSEFIGSGSLAHPEHAAWLPCTLQRKMATFFAMAKEVEVPASGQATVDVLVGLSYAGDLASAADPEVLQNAFSRDPAAMEAAIRDAEGKIYNLYNKYRDADQLDAVLSGMISSWDKYTSYLVPETPDELFNAYVHSDLPFQVLYQTYVSRAFAWTQKSYRETGFREIQDIYASMYYLSANGQNGLVRELISSWIENVWEMGYAYHNFTFRGKEPGDCSDDQLWLVQAVYRYVHLTGDTDFLNEEFSIAGTKGEDGQYKKRSLWETIRAILTYSGRISVGAHGLPLLDKADWNDTLRLDHGVMQGPAKEALYRKQLEETGTEYGVPLENDLSESVMNAFLLKIAADETAELAVMLGDVETECFARSMSEDVAESCRKHAWEGDFYARCLINDDREFSYLGAGGDGLSADPALDGSYFLNSYSWAVLSDTATEEEIRIMLDKVNEVLRTNAGLKLCTLIAYERLGVNTGTAFYFPGDRENCGVFKHAAMMASVASLKAAKTVRDGQLADDLRELAFFMIDKTLPYRTLEDPFVYKGNPRFCTQYNNSETGENIGPMLSGTASWLTLGIYEYFGLDVSRDEIAFSPVLRSPDDEVRYTADLGDAVLHVSAKSESGKCRTGEKTRYTITKRDDQAHSNTVTEFSGRMERPHSGEWDIEIVL